MLENKKTKGSVNSTLTLKINWGANFQSISFVLSGTVYLKNLVLDLETADWSEIFKTLFLADWAGYNSLARIAPLNLFEHLLLRK